MCYGQPLRASQNQCQAMLQCKVMQPEEFLLHLLLKCSLHYLRHKESQVASRRCSLLHFGSDFCYMFWDVFLERFWMHLCSLNCICSLVVLFLVLVFRYKFERFLKDLHTPLRAFGGTVSRYKVRFSPSVQIPYNTRHCTLSMCI